MIGIFLVPRLWCGSDFTQSFDWDAGVFDRLGQPVAIPNSNDGAGEPNYYSIDDAYKNYANSYNRPLWMNDIYGYTFFVGSRSAYINLTTNQPWTGVCEPPNVYSYTTEQSQPALPGFSSSVFGKNVVLCPKSFDPPAYGGNIHTLASLSNANYAPLATVPTVQSMRSPQEARPCTMSYST